jgi:hypothetical protein
VSCDSRKKTPSVRTDGAITAWEFIFLVGHSEKGEAMSSSIWRRALPLSLVALSAGIWLAVAGDLNPPPGPITPTMKTLDEVEPRIAVNSINTPGDADSLYTISVAGSYYLTETLEGVPGKHGIKIDAHPVTLNMNGFALHGTPGSLAAIKINPPAAGRGDLAGPWWLLLEFKASHWETGVLAPDAPNVHLRGAYIGYCSGGGVDLGANADLRDVKIENCGGDAITLRSGAIVRDTVAIDNVGAGVAILPGASGVELHNVSVFGSGIGLLDQGVATILDGLDIEPFAQFGSAPVTLGASCTVNGLTVKARDSNLSTAIVDVVGDGVSVNGLNVAALGTTTAPTMLHIGGSNLTTLGAPGCSLVTATNIPICIVVDGATNTLDGISIKNVPASGIGIRVAGGGNKVQDVDIAGSGAGAYTGVQLTGNNNLVVNNVFARLMGGTAVDNQGTGNGVGPVLTAAQIATATNPYANLAH